MELVAMNIGPLLKYLPEYKNIKKNEYWKDS